MKRITTTLVALSLTACATIPGTPSWFPAPEVKAPRSAVVGHKVTIEIKGTDPGNVHEYQTDFGDKQVSKWDSKGEKVKHVYQAEGTFKIKARERCPLRLFESDWSDEAKIMVVK